MPGYLQQIEQVRAHLQQKDEWKAVKPEFVVRMRLQNRFRTGLEIAQYTADIMRRDMAAYDKDPG